MEKQCAGAGSRPLRLGHRGLDHSGHSPLCGRSAVAAGCRVVAVRGPVRTLDGLLLSGGIAVDDQVEPTEQPAVALGSEWRGLGSGQFYRHLDFDGNQYPRLPHSRRSVLRPGPAFFFSRCLLTAYAGCSRCRPHGFAGIPPAHACRRRRRFRICASRHGSLAWPRSFRG